MKQKSLIAIVCLAAVCLTGCQKSALSESCWKSAKKADSLESYVREHADEIDVEALKTEAGSQDSTLSRQFKATALLCALESQSDPGYPVSSSYADSYLAKVNTEGEEFWKVLEESFYPHDDFQSIFAAADHLDAQTLTNLISGIPANSSYAEKFREAVGKYIRENPAKTAAAVPDLEKTEYFKDWSLDDWKRTYLYSYTEPGLIQTDTADEAIAYISCLRGSMLPMLEAEFGTEEFQEASELTNENYYSTNLTVTVADSLSLKEPDEASLPETIETEGKKIAAFYQNPHTEEFKDSPAPLRLLGDFMLSLPDEEYPQSLAEADYYLVLTPSYEYGDFYTDMSGKESKIQQVSSSTSVDLYESGTGTLLRHLGNVMEHPSSSIFEDLSEESAEYPELTASDILSYIYHHVNEPDSYAYLMDHTAGKSELQAGESIILGNWEITYHSCKISQTFDSGMFRFTADDGMQIVRGEFTVANCGTESDTFLPTVYYTDQDPVVQISDADRENYYESVNALNDSRCLSNTSLEPGESRDGELIFQIPTELAQGTEPLCIVVSLDNRSVFYPLER